MDYFFYSVLTMLDIFHSETLLLTLFQLSDQDDNTFGGKFKMKLTTVFKYRHTNPYRRELSELKFFSKRDVLLK